MRAWIFRMLLTLLEKHTPDRIRSIQLQILLNTTAAAFNRPKKKIRALSGRDALAAYAAYTTACMSGSAPDRKRIYHCARSLGNTIRKVTGFSEPGDLKRLIIFLYGNIGIKVTGQLPGEIMIPVCYFSNVYTPGQCRTMSFMDWGIISGICGGGRLIFRERITEGCGRCMAHLSGKGVESDEQKK